MDDSGLGFYLKPFEIQQRERLGGFIVANHPNILLQLAATECLCLRQYLDVFLRLPMQQLQI